ncbi:MAG: 3-hydroxybutyryl-CoA dehydrogenase [Chloroflexi bacterium]|nr:3-hydroxybutyryl-CoA dehydrogenase [Chloroflexota bacterium]
MGRGIAEVSARAGYDVLISEINRELLDRGLAAINASLSRAVERGRATAQEKAAAESHIKGTTDVNDFRDCDLVIEAVIENLEVKKKVFADLDSICPPHAILASNTSCLSVMDMAAVTKRLDKVLGIHFMNPVPVMKLVELVKTIATSDETISTARHFSQSVGKTPVTAPDIPGFIVNRVLIAFLLEAIRLYESGQATREDIDQAVMLGLNHPMGPLTLSDLIGLDTVLFISNAMYEELKAPQFAAPVLLKRMVTAGQFGRKSNKGFYDYK